MSTTSAAFAAVYMLGAYILGAYILVRLRLRAGGRLFEPHALERF